MTRQRGKTLKDEGIDGRNIRNILHKASIKMLFKQRTSTSMSGPAHNQTFITAVRTTVPKDALQIVPPDASVAENGDVELLNTGVAFSKKESQTLALFDLYKEFKECGVNAKDPPDVRKMRMEEAKDRQQARKNRSQLLLEMVGASRPIVTTSQKGKNFVTEVSMFIDGGKRLEGLGQAISKAGSEAEAIISVVDKPLIEVLGRARVDELNRIIDASPANHVSMMSVPSLPDRGIDVLVEAMGSPSEHDERMAQLEEIQTAFEAKFVARQESKWRKSSEGPSKAEEILKAARASRAAERTANENSEYIEEEEKRLQRAVEDDESPQGVMKKIRDALPIKAIREELVEALRDHQVVVVSGGTGSGKSTQCPQYILEDAIAQGQGPNTRIIVTQPRRIAAISVAERVAAERDEPIGNSVGFAVRLHGNAPRDAANIEFVTTGVLLRRLMRDQELEGISHVMIDEVHERDINTDFLLVLLRELISTRPDLRVILMSATLDAESFSDYFAGPGGMESVPLMSVPTKPRHPVEILHLEDMLDGGGEVEIEDESLASEESSDAPRREIPRHLKKLAKDLLAAQDVALQRDLEEAEAEEMAARQLEKISEAEDERVDVEVSEDEDDEDGDEDEDEDSEVDSELEDMEMKLEGTSTKAVSPRRLRASSRVRALRRAVALRNARTGESSMKVGVNTKSFRGNEAKEVSELTIQLLIEVAKHVAALETDAGRQGSILCFLPGWDEIKSAMSILEETTDPDLYEKLLVIPLHSTIPQEEQQKVFIPAKEGVVKVILATNIAESSVTINDVLAVVDSGLVREMSWNAESGMSTMQTVTTSRASATQRTGRAGRVAPGSCYRIYSHGTLHAMAERPTPEIQRTALEATCLQTCSMTHDGVQHFLSKAMDPPSDETVEYAMDRLFKLGAIKPNEASGGEILTPMGRLLSVLPLDPGTGRMLIMGAVMKCLDPVLTAAACFSSRDPFYVPPGMRDEAREIRQSFCATSDLLATVRAYDTFQDVLKEQGWDGARRWASDNFVSIVALNTITSVRSQLLHELNRIGLVQDYDLDGRSASKKTLRYDASVNYNASNESLFTAVWASGLPGNIASRRQFGNFGTLRTRVEEHAGLHPSSVAFHRKPPRDRTPLPRWFLYKEMMLSSQVFLRDVTAMRPEQLMLLGGHDLSKRDFSGDDASSSSESASPPSPPQPPLLDESGQPIVEESTSEEENIARPRTMLDDWIVVDSQCADTMDLLTDVRREIDAALALKVMSPRKPLPDASEDIVDAVGALFRILDERDAFRQRQFRRRDADGARARHRDRGFRGTTRR